MNLASLKHKIKKSTPDRVFNALARVSFVRTITGIGYFGLFKLDKKIAPFLPKSGGFYVELGANDGVTQSNTYHFEKYKNFTGVLIEPIPAKFEQCRKNRSNRNYFANNACVGFDFTEPTVELLYSNLMTTTLAGTSDILDRYSHAKSGEHLVKSNIYKFEITAKTLNQILFEAGAPSRIDLLSLDVEGSELEVLKGVNFDTYVFSVICIESRDLDRIRAFLEDKNYKLHKKLSMHDYLFTYFGNPAK